MSGPRLRAAAALAAAVLPAACTHHPSGPAPTTTRADCPASYRAPDPHRPRVTLAFDLRDPATVTGRETVRFTPDRTVDRLVFRLVPETPYSYGNGARLQVGTVTVDGRVAKATADPADRSLLRVPLAAPVAAGHTVTAVLGFTLRLPPATAADRLGYRHRTSWWGSGFPLLAWETGRGWAEEHAVDLLGEVATSEATDTDVTVTAPQDLTVLMTGRTDAPRAAPGGRRAWHAHAATARDVSVAVAPFTVQRTTVGGTEVAVGAAPDLVVTADALLTETTRSLTELVRLFGPFPFDTLTVAALPGLARHGVEYPAAVQVGDERVDAVVAHELAHEWFYALVGNDQARDPWLDEAFATYAQALLDPVSRQRVKGALSLPERVDRPMSFWAGRQLDYANTVYGKGGDALLTARQRAKPAAFDAAMRCYLRDNAWQIATPDDVARALAAAPAAAAVLRRAGALP